MTEDVDSTFKPSLTTISIGPGIRGIERGIENSGTRLDHIAYVEIEALIIENLVSEMEKGLLAPAIIWSDGKTFPAELFRGKVNLLLAGYPCQPFSHAGMRKGTEDPRHLYPYIERTIDIIRPHAVFLENVRGHITLGFREVIASLEGLGYRVRWGIFSAEETGASHKRERVFILAIREECLELSSGMGRKQSELIDKNGEARKTELADPNNGPIFDLTVGYEKNGTDERLQQWNVSEKFSESIAMGKELNNEKIWHGKLNSGEEGNTGMKS